MTENVNVYIIWHGIINNAIKSEAEKFDIDDLSLVILTTETRLSYWNYLYQHFAV